MRSLYIAFLIWVATILPAQTLTHDLASSPREGGSTSSGYLAADWGNFASRVNVFYDTSSATTDEAGFTPSLRSESAERFQLDVIPYSASLRKGPLQLKGYVGASWNQLNDRFHSIFFDAKGLVANNAGDYVSVQNKRAGTLLSPLVGLGVLWEPEAAPLSASFEGFVSPVYYLYLDQTMQYDFFSSVKNNVVQRFSTPYFEYKVELSWAKWFRISVEQNFQRLDFQTFDWNTAGTDLAPVDDLQEVNVIKLGASVLLPLNDNLRLRLGGYYELSSLSSSHWGTLTQAESFRPEFGSGL